MMISNRITFNAKSHHYQVPSYLPRTVEQDGSLMRVIELIRSMGYLGSYDIAATSNQPEMSGSLNDEVECLPLTPSEAEIMWIYDGRNDDGCVMCPLSSVMADVGWEPRPLNL